MACLFSAAPCLLSSLVLVRSLCLCLRAETLSALSLSFSSLPSRTMSSRSLFSSADFCFLAAFRWVSDGDGFRLSGEDNFLCNLKFRYSS